MSKELEALNEIRECLYGDIYSGLEKKLDIIEKELKALEIIKDKRVDVFGLICCMKLNEYTALETYNLKENCHNYCLIKEEYDLLKEVLLMEKLK